MSAESTEVCAGCNDAQCKRREAWATYTDAMSTWIRSLSVAQDREMLAALREFRAEYLACYARIDARFLALKAEARKALENHQ